MLLSTFVAIVLGLWSSFHLLHNIACSNVSFGPKLESFLCHNNIFITPFNIRWFTQRWNRWISGMGRWRRLSVWFDAGILFGAISMVGAVILLSHTLKTSIQDLQIFREPTQAPADQVLTVIVPGVNLPISDVGYLFCSILLCGIFHELGHAIAAVREGLKMEGFAVFVFVIYPGAGVHLDTEDMNKASTRKQLRVYCAGVWHNFIICIVAAFSVLVLPTLLLPLYSHTGSGVVLTHQSDESPLRGESGLHRGDIITSIGHCPTKGSVGWLHCINETMNTLQTGSCITKDKINQLELITNIVMPSSLSTQNYVDCCGSNPPQTHLCYKYATATDDKYACMPGRVVMSGLDCVSNRDCDVTEKAAHACAIPYLEPEVRFIRITVKRDSHPPSVHHVLFLGQPIDLLRHLTVSEYKPRFSWLPLKLPAMVLRLFQYMFSMSGALALFNIVPCYALDGQWAFKAFLEHFYGSRLHPETKQRLCSAVLGAGSLLIAANIVFGFLHIWWR